jgi:putative peptide zinc metalloprotease protein
MNLAEALNVALPELPVQTVAQKRLPRLDPDLIMKEQIIDGKPVVMVVTSKPRRYYPLPHEQWALLQLFDGQRTYREIAEIATAQTSVLHSEDYVREFAETMMDQPFWYKTPQEQNISLWQKLTEQRRRKTQNKSRFGDLAEINFSAWDPNAFLTKAHSKLGFVFSRGFVIFNLVLFAFTAYVWVSQWGQIGRDSLEYYTFTHKGLADIVEFWVLIFLVGFLHESSHGLVCKHTGGEVHRMGFLLIYLSPCFFCDVTEAWVFGSKWQRITTMAAGLWSELILCGFATLAWWGLPPGGLVHEISYKIILIAGVAALLINLNPLVKLDGYYIFTEMLEVSQLKENSTDFTTSWVKKKIFRLPVAVPHVPWRRRLLFVPYAILSGAYGYVLLFFVVRFVYNVAYNYSPQWAFLPALGLAGMVFRSRIRTLGRFLHSVYLDKKDLLKAQLQSRPAMAGGAILLLMLFVPFWRESVPGRFALQPIQKYVARAQVPGQVVEVRAEEGESITAGTLLLRLRNLKLESELARAKSDYELATDRATRAQLRNADYAPIEQEREQLAMRIRLLRDQAAQLALPSEISGIVATPRLQDLLGSYVRAGTELAEVADLSTMKARIYVSESDLRRVRVGSMAKLHVDGLFPSFEGTVMAIAPAVSNLEAGVMEKEQYVGLHSPHYYFADIAIANPKDTLRIGMTGEAKIFVRRRSLAGMVAETARDFVSRKLW